MSQTYEGPATVSVLALYQGQPPVELTTLELPIQLKSVDTNRARIEFAHYLQGPKEANVLLIELPDGRMLHGPIVDGRNEPAGGWLEFDVEHHALGVEKRINLNGWKWV